MSEPLLDREYSYALLLMGQFDLSPAWHHGGDVEAMLDGTVKVWGLNGRAYPALDLPLRFWPVAFLPGTLRWLREDVWGHNELSFTLVRDRGKDPFAYLIRSRNP